jgi:hypothetical protein
MKYRKTRRCKKSIKQYQSGGVLPFLDVSSETLENEYELEHIGAHGLVISSTPNSFLPYIKVVPENTYIIFIAPSGMICGHDTSILNLLTVKDDSAREKVRFYNTFSKMLKGQNDNVKFYEYNVEYNESKAKHRATSGIYEPGDSYPDILLKFHTEFPTFFETGIYKLPMKYELVDKLYDFDDKKDEYNEKELKSAIQKHTQWYANHKDNLLKYYPDVTPSDRHLLLSQIVETPQEPIDPAKKRIIVVFACRVSPAISENIKKARARTLRRFSVLQRHNKSRIYKV